MECQYVTAKVEYRGHVCLFFLRFFWFNRMLLNDLNTSKAWLHTATLGAAYIGFRF